MSAQPVDPSQAQGAQIPLSTFDIPDFPANARGLKALTLTSTIAIEDYADLLEKATYTVPSSLPRSIESLTLELFSLGYPPGFLSALAAALPNLKSLVVYSQLLAGTTAAASADAVEFFRRLRGLRALHLLDVFARPGFFAEVAKWVRYCDSDVEGEARRGLMFLELSYTFRGGDEEFMTRIPARELAGLVGPGLVSCALNVSPEEAGEEESEGKESEEEEGEGVMAFNSTLAPGVVKSFTNDECPKGLRALNLTLYTLTIEQVKEVLGKSRRVMVVNLTVDIEPGETIKRALLAALEQCEELEQVEIVANPSLTFVMEAQNPHSGVLAKTFPNKEDIEALSKKCPKLSSFKANVLRTTRFGTVGWNKKDGKWTGGVADGKGLDADPEPSS